jgi:NCAIR mutase (PurE)-related protein
MFSIKDVLCKVAAGELSFEEAEKTLKLLSIDEVGCFAKLDGNREIRKGVPEVILAEGKSPQDVAEISSKMLDKTGRAIISRCSKEHIAMIQERFGNDVLLMVNDKARMVVIKTKNFVPFICDGRVGLLTAGTSDVAVAEEARIICEEMGCKVFSSYDVGVAGIHRLIEPVKAIVEVDVDVVVVVAGREGALATVVAGLVDVPVVAVPTSNSYGFGEKGLSALMAMLQSCSLGLAVVNVDGGVAAGAMAGLIANRVAKFRKN